MSLGGLRARVRAWFLQVFVGPREATTQANASSMASHRIALYVALLLTPLAHGYILPSFALPFPHLSAAAGPAPGHIYGHGAGKKRRFEAALAGPSLVPLMTRGNALLLQSLRVRLQTKADDQNQAGYGRPEAMGVVAYPWPPAEDETRRARFRLPSAKELPSPLNNTFKVTLFDRCDAQPARGPQNQLYPQPTDDGFEVVLLESIPGPTERPSDENVRREVALMLALMHNVMLKAQKEQKRMTVVVDFTSHLRLPRPQLWASIAWKLNGFAECLIQGFGKGIPVAEATLVLPHLDMVSRNVFIPPAQQLAARLGVRLHILDKAQGGEAALAAKKRTLGI